MARLSKADWNKLKKQMGTFKGTLLKGVKWTTGRKAGRPKKGQTLPVWGARKAPEAER